jgi:isoamylase
VCGDEFGHTQGGNNNVYCQDNETSWINWDLSENGKVMLEFTRRLIKLRQTYPMLRRGRFLVGEYNEQLEVKDVSWIAPTGEEMTEDNWHDPNLSCFGMIMDGRAQPTGIHRRGSDATLMLILNAQPNAVNFTLPQVPQGAGWRCLIDTNQPQKTKHEFFNFEHEFVVTDRSLRLFELKKSK